MRSTEFEDMVWMLGPLHIKQIFIKVIGDWLENGDWTDVYDYANIPLDEIHLVKVRGLIHQVVSPIRKSK